MSTSCGLRRRAPARPPGRAPTTAPHRRARRQDPAVRRSSAAGRHGHRQVPPSAVDEHCAPCPSTPSTSQAPSPPSPPACRPPAPPSPAVTVRACRRPARTTESHGSTRRSASSPAYAAGDRAAVRRVLAGPQDRARRSVARRRRPRPSGAPQRRRRRARSSRVAPAHLEGGLVLAAEPLRRARRPAPPRRSSTPRQSGRRAHARHRHTGGMQVTLVQEASTLDPADNRDAAGGAHARGQRPRGVPRGVRPRLRRAGLRPQRRGRAARRPVRDRGGAGRRRARDHGAGRHVRARRRPRPAAQHAGAARRGRTPTTARSTSTTPSATASPTASPPGRSTPVAVDLGGLRASA